MKPFLFLLLLIITSCATQPDPDSNQDQNSNPETKSSNNDYYENGNIRIERKRLGNGDSLWIFKQEDGGCWEENYYRDGEIYRKIVYNSDCTKSADYEIKNGNRNGKWENYFNNGKIFEKGIYFSGYPEGEFQYFDSAGSLTHTDWHFHKDTVKLIWMKMYNYNQLKEKLKKWKIVYTEDENIEVAGNKEYHFPILKWNNNEINFDSPDAGNGNKCESALISDGRIPLFNDKIKIGTNLEDLASFFQIRVPPQTNNVILYDFKNNLIYKFKFKDQKLTEFFFATKELPQ